MNLTLGSNVIIGGGLRKGPAILKAIISAGSIPDFHQMIRWLGDTLPRGWQSQLRAVDTNRYVFLRTDREKDHYVIIPEPIIERCISLV